jgi:membrane associated rhomboid family serine protease
MVVLPIYDRNTLKFIPFQWVTFSLIALNVLVFIWQVTLPEHDVGRLAHSAGMVPLALMGGEPIPQEWLLFPATYELSLLGGVWQVSVPGIPVTLTPVTYMFLHANIWHLAGNMLFLYVFGDNVEDAMGHFRFLIFYLLCGIAGGLAHAMIFPDSNVPLVGASGAIAGIIAAYLILYPRVRMWALFFYRLPLPVPAWVVLAAWLGTQFLFIFQIDESGTAWWAHLGGFAAGAVLIVFMRRRGVPLFGDGTYGGPATMAGRADPSR